MSHVGTKRILIWPFLVSSIRCLCRTKSYGRGPMAYPDVRRGCTVVLGHENLSSRVFAHRIHLLGKLMKIYLLPLFLLLRL